VVLSFIITDQRSEHEFEAGVSVRQIERRQTEEHALRRAGRQRDRVDRDRQLAERELAAVGQHRVRRLRVVGWPRVRRRVAPEQRDDVDAVHHEVLHVTDEGHAVAVVAGRHLQLVDVECVSFARYIRYAYTRLLLIIISIIVVIIVIVIVIIVIIIVVIIIIARSQYDHYTSCVRHRSDYTRFPLSLRGSSCGSLIMFVGESLRLSCGRSQKVYVLNAVSTVPSRSSQYIFGFLGLNRISVKCDRQALGSDPTDRAVKTGTAKAACARARRYHAASVDKGRQCFEVR